MTSTHDGVMQRIDSSCERRIMTRAIAQVCPVRCLVVDRQQTIIRRVRRIIVCVRTTYDPLRTSPRLRPVKVSLAVVMHRHRSTVVFACISSTSHRNNFSRRKWCRPVRFYEAVRFPRPLALAVYFESFVTTAWSRFPAVSLC